MTMAIPQEKLRHVESLTLPPAEPNVPEPAAQEPPAEIRLTVEECRVTALEHNLDLKVVKIDPSIAAERISQEEARFDAVLFSQSSLYRTDTPTAFETESNQAKTLGQDLGVRIPLRTGGTITFDQSLYHSKALNAFSLLNPYNVADASFSLSQPLLRDAGVRQNTHPLRVARYQTGVSEAETKLAMIRVLAEVDRAYWRLDAARRQLEVRRKEYDLAVALLEQARRKQAVGTGKEVDVLSAETGVAESLEKIIITDNILRDRERDIKRLLHKPSLGMETPTIMIPATPPQPVRYQLDAGKLVQAALAGRMEMLELELQLALSLSEIDYAKNKMLPWVSLDYRYSINGLGATERDAYRMLGDKDYEDHTVTLRAELPLGNRQAKSFYRQAIYQRQQRLATRQLRQEQISREIYNVVDQIEAGWQRIMASRQRAILAGRNLEAEQRQFDLGLRTSTDVLVAQNRLIDAQSSEIGAIADYQIAQVDLAYATGTLLGASRVDWEPVKTP